MSMFDDYLEILELACSRAGSAAKLSEATKVDPVTLSRWRHNQRSPTLVSTQIILDFLGLEWCEALALARGIDGNVAPSRSDRSEGDAPENLSALRARIAELEKELEETRMERERALAKVELLRDLLREEKTGYGYERLS